MQEWSVPVWGVAGALAAVVLIAVTSGLLFARALRGVRRRTAEELELARAESARLQAQVDDIERRLSSPVSVDEHEYVITRLGDEVTSEPAETTPVVPGPLFADLVLRESVVQAASLASGLRRALAPETRNRIRFEMKREVKRARKQRRADLRQARREWEARQRGAEDPSQDSTQDSAA
jgi:hypothetical protein